MTDVTKTCRDINELLPAARKACNLFLSECKKAGLDIFITETYRSQARQNYLYEQGRTRAGKKVTWTKSSRHTSRLAWDIAVMPPEDLYDMDTMKKAGAIAEKLGITWGGNWKSSPDMPHFEVAKDWVAPDGSTLTNSATKASNADKNTASSAAIVPYPGKPLKVGSKGKDVERIQRALGIKVDGVFGEKTKVTVKAYQKRKGLVADGVVGEKSWNMLF